MIRISRLSRQWPEFTLRGIDLAIEKGEYFVILGPSGAGKTLLLELLAGIHRAEAGRIDLEGEGITDLPPEQRKIGMVYQDYALFPHLTVAKNIGYGLRYLKVPKEQRAIRVKEVARLVGVDHLLHRHPSTLSGGERQRVALARALVLRPKVLLLDEPLSALDHNTAKRLREYLKQLHKKVGITMIHVTHHRAEAKELADRIAVLRDGTIEAVGTVEEIFLFPPTRFVAEFVGADNLAGGTLTRIDAIPSAKGAARWEGVVAVEGLSLEAAATRAGTTPGAMKVRAHRAYRRLRELLARIEEER